MLPNSGAIRARMVAVLAIVAAVAGWAAYAASSLEKEAQEKYVARTMSNFFTSLNPIVALDSVYHDADGDLLADVPKNEALRSKPPTLVFSYITSEEPINDQSQWQELMDAIKEKTGVPVTFLRLTDSREQREAMRNGCLHITVLATGEVPAAVNTAGFVPICTFGREDGTSGYKMEFLVKADSEIKSLGDLRGKKIAFTRPNSNSGCKAPAMVLMEEENLQPERDYEWRYTYSHADSIKKVLEGDVDVAPIASDFYAREIANGAIKEGDLRSIYTSEQFPPAAFGYVYNLTPELKEKITEAFLQFNWDGTKIAESFGGDGSNKFVPVSYKDDWANIRRIDMAAANARMNLAAN